MVDTNNSRQKEVRVEDLLRIKRAELPDDAFWNTFDRELHQRMLQTLVKKDPWYVQILRGVSSRIAQTATVGAAAVFLAMMIVRPAFVDSSGQALPISSAKQNADLVSGATIEVAMSEPDASLTPDYLMVSVSGATYSSELGFIHEYAHDSIEVSAYDNAAYVMDTASFAATGLATALVY